MTVFKKLRCTLPLVVMLTMLLSLSVPGAFAADSEGDQPAGIPEGMNAPPGGGPGGRGMGGFPGGEGGRGSGGPPVNKAPDKAAIYIKNGVEDTGSEYAAGKYKGYLTSDENGITIRDLNLTSGDYTFNGAVAVGKTSSVTLDRCKITLGVNKPASADDTGGSVTAASDGATMFINNSELQVDGAARYVTSAYDTAKMIINDSNLTSTGRNENTAQISVPVSNEKLLISGSARANFSVGATQTYYFNSTCTAEGWGALSTDSSTGNGLDLYAYNTKAIAQNGGYGTYADFHCRVWLYGATLDAAEIGAIISKSGQIVVADGAQAPESVLEYNLGKTTTAETTITGGRNAVMIHAPDMFGQGKGAADCGTLKVVNSRIVTSRKFKSTFDYAKNYGAAVGAYVDYVSGPAILVKSTSATIDLENAVIDSYSGVIAMTVINSDTMGNYLAEGDADSSEVKPIAVSMKNMTATGDIKHMDYQRIMTLSLENATLKGAVVSGTMADWNSFWSTYDRAKCNWVVNDSWNTRYGVRMTVKKGATWDVTGPSTLSGLTVESGGAVQGNVQVDGKKITPSPGQTYSGNIVVKPL